MHFANARTLAVMIAAWTFFLVAYDQHVHPKPLAAYWAEIRGAKARRATDSSADRPQLRLTMPPLCCEDCLGATRSALGRLAWLGPARPVADRPALDLDILDVEQAELAGVERMLVLHGLAPDAIEVFGMGHFRLSVELGGSFACSGGVDDFERLVRKESSDRWLDSIVSTPGDARTMLVYPRLNAVVDLMDLTRGLGRAGLTIRTIELRTDPE